MRSFDEQLTITKTVLVIDSGIGGMSIVQALQSLEQSVRIIYVADNAVFPYGEKPQQLIKQRLQQIIDFARCEYRIDAVVIACNTATVMHIDALRQHYSTIQLPFIGVVPPIKTASEQSQTRHFSVVATENTSQSPYLQHLIDEFAQDCQVETLAAIGLADYAENKIHGRPATQEQLASLLPIFSEKAQAKMDILVLGCTHYAFIKHDIAALLPKHIQIIEPSLPVAKRISWILADGKITSSNKSSKVITVPQRDPLENLFLQTQKQTVSANFLQFLQQNHFQGARVLSL